MTPKENHSEMQGISQADFHELLQEKLRLAVQATLMTVLNEEIDAFVGVGRYERGAKRRDQRNGSYERELGTGAGVVQLQVPRTRKGYKTRVFAKYKRRQAELDEAIAEMFVQGVSTARVGEIIQGLTHIQPSGSTVSRVFHTLEGEYESWKERELDEQYAYVFTDGTYFTIVYDGEGVKTAIIAAVGITLEGKREVLGFSVGERENQKAWEDFLADLKRRGMQAVDLWITDGHQAMINAIESQFPSSQRQRCVKHKMENVLSRIPKRQWEAVKPELRAIFYQESREQAKQEASAFYEKYEKIYSTAVECLKRDLDDCLTFYDFPQHHWKTIRTTNVVERLFLEVKKRSHKMAAAFRNEDSCLLMFYAVIRSLKFQRVRMPAKPKVPASALLHKT
jgi:putative transposase